MGKTEYFVGEEDGSQTLGDKVTTWAINHIGIWITTDWWRFVLDDSRADKEYGPLVVYYHELPSWVPLKIAQYLYDRFGFYEYRNPIRVLVNYLDRCRCRWTQHRCGVWWYNTGGYEPDMCCKGCGEDLG